ncbi:MAG: hypothetical protein M1829_001051 [Trizodia sp. TS-e1964]|nr:MAG: hypothetical protein M1829_001051 [Trizodia sp. TS-e1964]
MDSDQHKQMAVGSPDSTVMPSSVLDPSLITKDMKTEEKPSAPAPTGLGVWPLPITPPSNVADDGPLSASFESMPPYSPPEQYAPLAAWESGSVPRPIPQTFGLHGYPTHQTFYHSPPEESSVWVQKPNDDNISIHSLEADIRYRHGYEERIPVLEMRYPLDGEPSSHESGSSRRYSGSSFSVSSAGHGQDISPYGEYPEYPDGNSCPPPYPQRHTFIGSTPLSPVASPRQPSRESGRSGSRHLASPSPRLNMRTVPYPMESSRSKRWSMGTYTSSPQRHAHVSHFSHPPEIYHHGQRVSSPHASPTHPQVQLKSHSAPYQLPSQHSYHTPYISPASLLDRSRQFDTPPPLPSHGLFRMLQSSHDPQPHQCSSYGDLSGPPDLFASLGEKQSSPPPEDMNPSDPDLTPHEQELRFDGDLYTPRWVRGHGNKREGWCGICKPGRWLVLKNSAFWYDKSFTHGISAATGSPFQKPEETRRMDGNPDVWEGLCGSCNDWVALVSSKKKGTTWFRHAYKCHTHPKIKDAPKRRRESSHPKGNHEGRNVRQKRETSATGTSSFTNSPTPPPFLKRI